MRLAATAWPLYEVGVSLLRLLVLWMSLLVLTTPLQAWARIAASSADDICAPGVDPCVITDEVDVSGGATLDFGNRDLRIEQGGRLDFDFRSGSVLCGSFTAESNAAVINMKGVDSAGDVSGGLVRITAQSACAGNVARRCFADSDCMLGGCNTRRCSLRLDRACNEDANCDLGICFFGVCANDASVQCNREADCKLGSCTTSRRCDADGSFACEENADCEMGTCSVGEGKLDLAGRVTGSAGEPGTLILRSRGDLTVDAAILLGATILEGDGGEVELESVAGDVHVNARLDLTGGGTSSGGALTAIAAGDVSLAALVDAAGGDFDGGTVDIVAGGDVYLSEDINLNSGNAAGDGGALDLEAAGDVAVASGTASNRVLISADGHVDEEGFAGNGGTIDFVVGGDFVSAAFSTFRADGALPDGVGGDVTIVADGDIALDGQVELETRGQDGGGGAFDATCGGDFSLAESASIEVAASRGGAGEIDIVANQDLSILGTLVADANEQGGAGSIDLRSGATLELGGVMSSSGGVGQDNIRFFACRVRAAPGFELHNHAINGESIFSVRESAVFAVGAEVEASHPSGGNRIIYRDASKPPVGLSAFSPTPELLVDEDLVGCPVCGNEEIDFGEQCDDGNTAVGDGCSAECLDEGCLLATPGYPDVALCDDGKACTQDRCDLELHTCVHTELCDDGVACTDDACTGDFCSNIANNAFCSDGDVCTDDICLERSGCVNPTNTAPCDDGAFCTTDDRCDAGTCVGTPRSCSDGVFCTEDICDEASNVCRNPPSDERCDDGLFCTGTETCDAATDCASGIALECGGLDSFCAEGQCSESLQRCVATPVREMEPCDDGDVCTDADACVAGECRGTGIPECGICGNGVLDPGEGCDDGDTDFLAGDACLADCAFTGCGKPTGSGGIRPNTSDALFTLRAAVGLETCSLLVCDVGADGRIRTGDALTILQSAVGLDITLECQAP